MIVYLINHRTCHPERSETESKDLRTKILLSTGKMRRFFDSPSATLRVAQNDMRFR